MWRRVIIQSLYQPTYPPPLFQLVINTTHCSFIDCSSTCISLVPRCGGGGGERAPGTHCLHMHLITTEFCGDRVRASTYVYWWCHKLAALIMCSWCSVRYHTVLWLLVAGYLEIKLKAEQVASNECCLLRKHAFVRLSTNFSKSILTTAYQTVLFVPHSIKLDRALAAMFIAS